GALGQRRELRRDQLARERLVDHLLRLPLRHAGGGYAEAMGEALLVNLGTVDYREAWDLQRSVADRVGAGELPDTVLFLEHPPTIASIGIHLTKWVSTHGYALNVDLDPAPFTQWITACGLDGYVFTSMARELGTPLSVGDVRPVAAQAFADVFGVTLEERTLA